MWAVWEAKCNSIILIRIWLSVYQIHSDKISFIFLIISLFVIEKNGMVRFSNSTGSYTIKSHVYFYSTICLPLLEITTIHRLVYPSKGKNVYKNTCSPPFSHVHIPVLCLFFKDTYFFEVTIETMFLLWCVRINLGRTPRSMFICILIFWWMVLNCLPRKMPQFLVSLTNYENNCFFFTPWPT